jgi:hypothetical protein
VKKIDGMIITRLNGGLGNQMFQYAVGRSLSYVHNVPLKLDLTEFGTYNKRKFRLNHFNINAEIASLEEIENFKQLNKGLSGVISSLPELLRPYYKRKYIKEHFFHYDLNIRKCSGNSYLEGYWQSEKYFQEITPVILDDFTLRERSDSLNEIMAEKIKSCDAISLHVRRGDYVANPETNLYHGTCTLEYYKKAINAVGKHVENPHYFIFSDDPGWAKLNLQTGFPMTILDNNGPEKDYEDMKLMSLCKHHIIANSSFSWWGAWLCQNPNKIVFTPSRWFNKTEVEKDTKDLIPESWQRI